MTITATDSKRTQPPIQNAQPQIFTEFTDSLAVNWRTGDQATLQTAYEDVTQLFGKSQRIFCPMISGGGARQLFEDAR